MKAKKLAYPSQKKLRILQMNLKLWGFSQRTIAQAIGKSQGFVSQVLSRKRISQPTFDLILKAIQKRNR